MQINMLSIALLISFLASGTTSFAGKIEEAGALACVNDKWDEKEVEKDHKVVDYAGRCLAIPNDSAAAITSEDARVNTNKCPTKAGRAAARA